MSETVRNTARVDELILENRAGNITDTSTALELYMPLPMKNWVAKASLCSEIMLKINYTLWDK
jgi:hypothetical protein